MRWPASGILLALAVLLPAIFIWQNPLTERDEVTHVEVAREILTSGDWITLRFDGKPWYDKPPLVFWASAVSMRVFGCCEGGARLPVWLCYVALVALVWHLGREMFGPSAGLAAGAVAASAPMIVVTGQMVLLDIPLTLLFTVTLALFYKSTRADSTAQVAYLSIGAGAAMGLAVLTKGPVAIVLPGAIAALCMILSPSLRPRWTFALPTALIVAVVIAIPWHILVYKANGQAFLDSYFEFHNIDRFLKSEHARGQGPLLYLGVLLVGFMPWTAAVIQSVISGFRKWTPEDKLLGVWICLVLLFFGAASTRLAAYILPCFPPLAIWAGRYLAVEHVANKVDRILRVLNLVFLIILGAVLLTVSRKFSDVWVPAIVWAVTLITIGVLYCMGGLQKRITVTLFLACFLIAIQGGIVLPAVARQMSMKKIVLTANRVPGELFIWDGNLPGSVLFYGGKRPKHIDSALNVPGGGLVLLHKSDVPRLGAAEFLEQQGRWLLMRKL